MGYRVQVSGCRIERTQRVTSPSLAIIARKTCSAGRGTLDPASDGWVKIIYTNVPK